jgi:hypothetical protein
VNEDDVVLLDGGDTVVEDDVVLPEFVAELLEDEDVLPEDGDTEPVLEDEVELPKDEEGELLEDEGLGRRLLVRETLVVEVDVPTTVNDVVLLESQEVKPLVVLAGDVVLLGSEDAVFEDDVAVEEREKVGSPKVEDDVLEISVVLPGDVEVPNEDDTVVERLVDVESEPLRVVVVLPLEAVDVKLPEVKLVEDDDELLLLLLLLLP